MSWPANRPVTDGRDNRELIAKTHVNVDCSRQSRSEGDVPVCCNKSPIGPGLLRFINEHICLLSVAVDRERLMVSVKTG